MAAYTLLRFKTMVRCILSLLLLIFLLFLEACSDRPAPFYAQSSNPQCRARELKDDYIVKIVNRGTQQRTLSQTELKRLRQDPLVEWVEPNYSLAKGARYDVRWTYQDQFHLNQAKQLWPVGINGSGINIAVIGGRDGDLQSLQIKEFAPGVRVLKPELKVHWPESELGYARSLEWALSQGAKILILNSFGFCSQTLHRAFQAWKNLNVVFVNAFDETADAPPRFPNMIHARRISVAAGTAALVWSAHPDVRANELIEVLNGLEKNQTPWDPPDDEDSPFLQEVIYPTDNIQRSN